MITASLIQAILATPINDDFADPENPNLRVPVSELDPPPHLKEDEVKPDACLPLTEKQAGTINYETVIN